MKPCLFPSAVAGLTLALSAQAATITVTTADNINPPAGATSLAQALTGLQDGDVVAFNIAGVGPHFILTPPGGYPLITANNVVIDGYTQPGAAPNTNPILAPNNAQLRIVLDSRGGDYTSMNYEPDNLGAGYGDTEFAILGVFNAANVDIRGLCLLGKVPEPGDPSNYAISFARNYAGTAEGGHVNGCWIGVAPDGRTISGNYDGVTGFRHRDENRQNPVLLNQLTVGVAIGSTNPRAEFNVIVQQSIPIIVEGNGTRIAGNFIGVLPDGMTEVNVALDLDHYSGDFQFEGAIEIGRGDNNTVIGTDGDGVNDAEERNVIVGTLPPSMNGYDHTIEFYGTTPGTNIVIAGNYIGVAIDGQTPFTNGVAAVNAPGASAVYRIGSNFDGLSDELEGNVIFNNWPPDLFPAAGFTQAPEKLNFLDEISTAGLVSLRGNTLVNNFPFPVGPVKADQGLEGGYLTDIYLKVLRDARNGVRPVLGLGTSANLLVGTVPVADPVLWPVTIIDLYMADPVGLTNGVEAGIASLPNGFVQGRTYLGSFVDNGPGDRSPGVGQFNFDLSTLAIPAGPLTITANYASGPADDPATRVMTSPFAEPVTVTAQLKPLRVTSTTVSGGSVTLVWTGGTAPFAVLRKASLSDANWTAVATTSAREATVPFSGQSGFFRIRGQ